MSGGDAWAALVEASCGGTASAISTSALYPLEVAKSRMVVRTGSAFKRDTTISVLQDAVKEGGVGSLYRGLSTKCTHSVSQAFAYFYLYSFLKKAATSGSTKSLGTVANLGVGYLAGLGNIMGTIPLEVIALKMQLSKEDISPIKAASDIYQDGGFPAFYKGLFASALLCSNPAINMTVFDQLKEGVLKYLSAAAEKEAAATGEKAKKVVALSTAQAFVVGVIAKSIATLITYPYIRAKVVMQSMSRKSKGDVEAGEGGDGAGPKLSSSMSTWEVLRYIVQTEGVAGLFKGIGPQLFRSVLASALMLMLKERIYYYTRLALSGGANKK